MWGDADSWGQMPVAASELPGGWEKFTPAHFGIGTASFVQEIPERAQFKVKVLGSKAENCRDFIDFCFQLH